MPSSVPTDSGRDSPTRKSDSSRHSKARSKDHNVKKAKKSRDKGRSVKSKEVEQSRGSLHSHTSVTPSDMSLIVSARSSPMSARSASPGSDIPSGQPYPLSPFPQSLSPQVVLTRLPAQQEASPSLSHAAPTASDSGEAPLPAFMQNEAMRDMFTALSNQLVSLVKENFPASGAAKVDTVSCEPPAAARDVDGTCGVAAIATAAGSTFK